MSHTSASLSIYLLGPPRLECNGQPVAVDTRKAIALLAYLALHPEQLSRDQLAAFFWPEYDPERAYANLRRTLWALNKAIGEGWIAADNLSLHLRQQAGLWLDVLEFQQLLAQCRDHGHRSDEVCSACLEPLGRAVKLARGDFLEGFNLRDSAPFDDWLFFEAESLRKQVATTLEKLVQGHSRQQEDETAIPYARRWLALDPLHEPAHRWLMQLYAWTGQPAAALRQYQECIRILKTELDAPPAAETTALHNRIRARQLAPRPAFAGPTATPSQQATGEQTPSVPTPPMPAPPAPPAVVEAELRLVTVLCAALTEPLTATSSYPSTQRTQQMQRILQEAEAILRRYDGQVERILGEGVVAFFGSRQRHEDDPERAVRAALDLRQAAQQAGLQMSAGITSGYLYQSGQGAPNTTSGPVAYLALRLQAKADADQILVSESVYRQTRGVALYTPLSLSLPGQPHPVPLYQIERLHPHPHKVRGIAGLQAPLVGRAKELTALQEALTSLQQGEGQLVILIGEAGLGKSRLVSELRQGERQGDKELDSSLSPPHLVTLSPCLWLEGRCLEMSLSASYWPFLDILRAYLGWQPEENEARRAGRIVAALDALTSSGALTAAQRDEMGPLLGNLLAVRFGNDWDDRLRFAGPEQLRHQTLLTLRDLLVAIAHQQPLVLVLEDLHWADSLSLDLITLLLETLTAQPLLLLCVYRPEPQHRCWQLPTLAAAKCPDHFTEVRLRELTNKQSQQLVEALLTIENLTPKVKTTILQKAQGNPLFVEEVIRSLIDAGIVYRQGEVWRAKDEIENIVVPETVQSVILSRVDRLGEPLKSLLQRAAVIGRLFGRRLLAQLAPPGLDLDNAVLALTNQTFIYQERMVPEEEYSFKHVLVQEAIYQNTLSEKRQQFHRQVGEALEQLYPDNLAERYEQLAYHYDRSGVVEKAIEYLLKAGEKARRVYLSAEAVSYFQRVLEQTAALPLGQVDGNQARLQALQGLGEVCFGAGKVDEAESYFRQAIAAGQAFGAAPRVLARLYYWLGEVFYWQERHVERLRVGEEGLAVLGADTQSIEAAIINCTIAWGHYEAGNIEKAQAFIDRNIGFIESLPYAEELKSAYRQICFAFIRFKKNIKETRRWGQALERQALQHHDLRAVAGVYLEIIGEIHWAPGDLRGAIPHVQRALQLYTQIGDAKHQCLCLDELAWLWIRLGDHETARRYALRGFEIVQDVGLTIWLCNTYHQLSVIALCQGDWATAEEMFQKYIQFSQETHNLARETWGILRLIQAHWAQGNRQEALQLIELVLPLLEHPEIKLSLQQDSYDLVVILKVLEEIWQDSTKFRIFCLKLRTEEPELTGNPCQQWFLEPTQINSRLGIFDSSTTSIVLQGHEFHTLPAKIQNKEWEWQDGFGDCAYRVDQGLEILAANGRGLGYLNLSAPRLLHRIDGDFVAQTICLPASATQPAIGGLLLWKDAQNYLRLDKGLLGERQISFWGRLADKDMVLGRGLLPATRALLRLERQGIYIRALCSVDGEEWFRTGEIEFPVTDPMQIGLYALGDIDRLIYPGAYPDGTAIRFESFAVYKPTATIELTSEAEPRIV